MQLTVWGFVVGYDSSVSSKPAARSCSERGSLSPSRILHKYSHMAPWAGRWKKLVHGSNYIYSSRSTMTVEHASLARAAHFGCMCMIMGNGKRFHTYTTPGCCSDGPFHIPHSNYPWASTLCFTLFHPTTPWPEDQLLSKRIVG